jgi:ribonuclease D
MELIGHDLNKDQQQTNWAQNNLSSKQLEYAANDVLELVQIYRKLTEMMDNRPALSSGTTINELNIKAQAMLPSLIDLLINGYGDKNGGWESSLFSH